MADTITQIQLKRGTWEQFLAKQATTPLLDGEVGVITDKGIFVVGYDNGKYFTTSSTIEGKLTDRPEPNTVGKGSLFIELSDEETPTPTGIVYISNGEIWVKIGTDVSSIINEIIDDEADSSNENASKKVWSISKVSEKLEQVKNEVANERDWKESVKVATTENLTALSGLLTVDGITLEVGDRILVKDQTAVAENGIYIVSETAWTKAPDSVKLTAGAAVSVEDGTQANQFWILTKNLTTWVKFSTGSYTDGDGLNLEGGVFSVKSDTTTEGVMPVTVTSNGVSTSIDSTTLEKTDEDKLKVKLSSQFSSDENGIKIVTINGGEF